MDVKRSICAAFAWLALASPGWAQEAEEDPSVVMREMADSGYSFEYGRTPGWHLADHRKLAASLAALQPQRPGTIDAYVIVIGLDSDGVFGREATEAARVLAHRYDASGRTLLLAAGDGHDAPNGSPQNLALAIGAVAATMDAKEDVLVLYTTSHGDADSGLAYRDDELGNGMIGPGRLKAMLDDSGIERRLVMISACYSGIFVPALQSDTSIVITAASAKTTSFGCASDNDWTFFGDALLNNAFRTSDPLPVAARKAFGLINAWERKVRIGASKPQLFIGKDSKIWLASLEARTPKQPTPKVGRPALQTTR
jgi:hypothetical protein